MSARRAIIAVGVLVGSGLIGLILAHSVLVGHAVPLLGGQDAQAATRSDTYALSSFEIEYPYNDPGTEALNQALAGVSFTAAWSGNTFPGDAQCSVALKDASGNTVGQETFLATYAPNPADVAPIQVEVSNPPTSAEGSCQPGTYDPSAGYRFALESIGAHSLGNKDMSTATFTVHWTTESDPSVRACSLRVVFADGEVLESPFTFSGPDGAEVRQGIPAPKEQVKEATVGCDAIDGAPPG